jgi:hypothetical protein
LHWSHAEILDLAITDRRAYAQLLSEQIERENKAMEQAARRRSSPRVR